MITDRAPLPGEGGIVDDRRLLAAPAQDMTVDGVPASVADATGEPAPIDAGVGVEYLLGRIDPVDVLRRFSPKILRVTLPARINLMIAARAGVHATSAQAPAPTDPQRGRFLHCEAARKLCKSRQLHNSAMQQEAGARRRPAVSLPAFRHPPCRDFPL